MSTDTYDHDFDAEEPLCANCGEAHSDCTCEEFEIDPDTEDVCSVCGMSEADEAHQTEE